MLVIYGEGLYKNQQHAKWFARFRSINFDVKDEHRSGRLITEKSDEILEKIEQYRHISSHDIAYELNIHHETVFNHLQKDGFNKKLDVWVPHELNVKKRWTDLKSTIRCRSAMKSSHLLSEL